MNIIVHSKQVIDLVRAKTDKVILFFSCGKDSLVTLDLIAPHFKEVVCVYMYFVKDLDHVNNFLRYAESKYPNVRVIQVPHWNMSRVLKIGLYCQPHPKVKLLMLKDIVERVRINTGIDWCFYGMKQADGLHRRLMLRGYELEAVCEKTKNVYPLSMWKKGDVLSYIRMHKLPTPIQYSTDAGNGLWFDLKVYLFLRESYPEDLKTILRAFPLSEKILYDYDCKEAAHREHGLKAQI